jgi:chromosome segregation ATPase
MKKTHYSAILLVAILAIFAGSVAFAQEGGETPDKPGIWGRLFGPKQEKIDDQKERLEEQRVRIEGERAKLEEQRLKRASTTAKIEDRLQNREDRLASTTAKIEVREERRASSTEARKARLEDKFKKGIANQIAKVNDRLSDAIDRITKIDTRLVAHIAKLKAKNVDTTASDALLVTAQAKLALAKEKVTTLNTSLQAILTDNVSTTTKNTIKAKTAEANTYVKAAHEAYINVVENLKPGRNKEDKVATSTATTTP